MKKYIILFIGIFVFTACLNDDDYNNTTFKDLPVDDYTVPDSFTFGEKDTITVTYSLPSSCYTFHSIYYQPVDTTRIVAVRALVDLDATCTEEVVEKEHKFVVTVAQEEDYVFRFFKGQDDEGNNIFENVTVPVN